MKDKVGVCYLDEWGLIGFEKGQDKEKRLCKKEKH